LDDEISTGFHHRVMTVGDGYDAAGDVQAAAASNSVPIPPVIAFRRCDRAIRVPPESVDPFVVPV
jgi:hypothetical protein